MFQKKTKKKLFDIHLFYYICGSSQPTASEKDSTHAPGMANKTEKWLSIVKPNDGSKKELPQNEDSSTSFLTRELTNYEKSQAMGTLCYIFSPIHCRLL